jgi:intein/homing endonuclease
LEECLPYDTEIITSRGVLKIGKIVELHEKGEKIEVLGYDISSQKFDFYPVTKSYRIPKRELLEIVTECGNTLKCTPDHLVLTRKGFIPAENANEIGMVLEYPHIKRKDLVIARLVGYLLADGWLSKNGEVGFCSASNSDRDLYLIKEDLQFLGFNSSKIVLTTSVSQVTTQEGKKIKISGSGKSVVSSVKAFKFFSSLGVPIGDKTSEKFLIPTFVMKGSKEVKAEFLAALMGGDGYIQISMKRSPQSFPPIRFTFNKLEELKQNGIEYANQLKSLFEELGLKVSSISIRKANIRKDGKKTLKFVVTLSNSKENLRKYLEIVGFRYCLEKERKGREILAYLKAKEWMIKENQKKAEVARKLYKEGISLRRIAKMLGSNKTTIKRWIERKDVKIRAPTLLPFKDWIKERCNSSVLFEKIVKKSKCPPEDLFDIQVDKVHNFVAKNFIVHNCHNFIPSDKEVASSEPIKIIAKQGREPGIGLIVITQMPGKVHQDILSQTDIVISFRLTSKDDIQALHSVAQTYMQEELEAYINSLPRWPGAALIIDDNLEKIFLVSIRPRCSWHSGGTAAVV